MIRSFIDYARSFFDFAGKRATVAFVLVFVGALLDGFGLVMLLPFIEIFAGTNTSGFSVRVTEFFASLGIVSKSQQLITAMVGFLIILFLRNAIGWFRDTYIKALSQGFVDQWRMRLFSAIAKAPWPRVMNYQRTDLEHAINADVGRLNIGTDKIVRGSIVVVMMVVQIGIALFLSPSLTLIVLLFISVSGLLLYPTIKKARNLGDFTTRAGRRIHEVLGQFMSGLKLAKAHNAEQG